MMHTIERGGLSARISEMGAELQSLTKNGREYLWQGDENVWSGRSPILFPIVGRLNNDEYIYRDWRYLMPKHGFAMKSRFEAERVNEGKVVFTLRSGEHQENYPFDFRLSVTYELEEDALKVTHRVENDGADVMYFSLGAHPAFQCEMGDYLLFPDDESALAHRLVGERLMLSETATEPAIAAHRLVVTKDVFARDALIFQGLRSDGATLVRADGTPRVTVEYGNAPCLGVWAKPGAQYVCIEPWYGVDSKVSDTSVLRDKPYVVSLEAGHCFRFPMRVIPR